MALDEYDIVLSVQSTVLDTGIVLNEPFYPKLVARDASDYKELYRVAFAVVVEESKCENLQMTPKQGTLYDMEILLETDDFGLPIKRNSESPPKQMKQQSIP